MEALVQDIIVNSPLVHRRSRGPQESPIKFFLKQDSAETEKKQKNSSNTKHRKIRNFFGGMMSSVRNVMNQLITSPLDNSIPLMDCVAARGNSALPRFMQFCGYSFLKLGRIQTLLPSKWCYGVRPITIFIDPMSILICP